MYFTYQPNLKDITEYKESPNINQSLLKFYLFNKESSKEDKKNLAMIMGSFIDCLITSPFLVEELFYISSSDKLSENIQLIIDKLWNSIEKENLIYKPLDEYAAQLIEIANELEYRVMWKDETRLTKILLGKDYWESLHYNINKTPLSREDWNKGVTIAHKVINNPLVKDLFDNKQVYLNYYFQKAIYWEETILNGLEKDNIYCKALIDIYIVDTNKKEILLIDLKTTQLEINSWLYHCCRGLYYPFQMSFYKEGLQKLYPHFNIKCEWVYINTNDPDHVYRIECNQDILNIGMYGFTSERNYTILAEESKNFNVVNNNLVYKGWLECLYKYNTINKNQHTLNSYFYEQTNGKINSAYVLSKFL